MNGMEATGSASTRLSSAIASPSDGGAEANAVPHGLPATLTSEGTGRLNMPTSWSPRATEPLAGPGGMPQPARLGASAGTGGNSTSVLARLQGVSEELMDTWADTGGSPITHGPEARFAPWDELEEPIKKGFAAPDDG